MNKCNFKTVWVLSRPGGGRTIEVTCTLERAHEGACCVEPTRSIDQKAEPDE